MTGNFWVFVGAIVLYGGSGANLSDTFAFGWTSGIVAGILYKRLCESGVI